MSSVATPGVAPKNELIANFAWLRRAGAIPPQLLAFGLAVVCIAAFGIWLRWENLTLSVQVSSIASLLAPLAFAAAVLERGVEILVSPWRDAQANKLEAAFSAIKSRQPDPATAVQNAADVKAASDALDEYRGETQKYAFAISLTLATLVSIAGVRAFGPFLDAAKFHMTSRMQQIFFLCIDVGLSAALLSGGADAVHSVMNAVTGFFDATAQRAKS